MPENTDLSGTIPAPGAMDDIIVHGRPPAGHDFLEAGVLGAHITTNQRRLSDRKPSAQRIKTRPTFCR
jgi:hypothetical protein